MPWTPGLPGCLPPSGWVRTRGSPGRFLQPIFQIGGLRNGVDDVSRRRETSGRTIPPQTSFLAMSPQGLRAGGRSGEDHGGLKKGLSKEKAAMLPFKAPG